MTAIIYNRLEITKELLRHIGNLDLQNKEGNTTLMLSIMHGNLEAVIQLIYQGTNLNLQNQYGITALMIAIINGQKELTSILIEYGADLNIKTKMGDNALTIAVKIGSDPIKPTGTSLNNSQIEIFDLLLSKGAIVDSQVEKEIIDSHHVNAEFKFVLIKYRNIRKLDALQKSGSSYFSVIPNDLIGVIKNNF